MGCWPPVERFSPVGQAQWKAVNASADGGRFDVHCHGKKVGSVDWELTGRHNIANAVIEIVQQEFARGRDKDNLNRHILFTVFSVQPLQQPVYPRGAFAFRTVPHPVPVAVIPETPVPVVFPRQPEVGV